jgi:hypothetical protein
MTRHFPIRINFGSHKFHLPISVWPQWLTWDKQFLGTDEGLFGDWSICRSFDPLLVMLWDWVGAWLRQCQWFRGMTLKVGL